MSTCAWGKQLCETVYRTGALTVEAEKKCQLLLEGGLHPEQVLIGTGLVSIEGYTQAIRSLFSVELVRLDEDALALTEWPFAIPEQYADMAQLFEREDQSRVLAVADVWDWPESVWKNVASQAKKRSIEVQSCFLSELQAFQRPAQNNVSIGALAEWGTLFLATASEKKAHAAFLFPLQKEGEVYFDEWKQPETALTVPASLLPTIRVAVEDGPLSQEWRSKEEQMTIGSVLALTHREGATHPLQRLQSFERFWHASHGCLLCVDLDPFARAFVEERAPMREQKDYAWKQTPSFSSMDVTNEEGGLEEIAHRLLAGERVCLFVSEKQLAFFSEIARVGVPLHVLRARRHEGEIAWEFYSF